MPQLVRGRRRTCDPPTCNRDASADIQRLFTSFWELTMISRFHVYRYSNCMLLYNISTLHHRDDGSFSRINLNDASLVGLPAPRHRSLQGTRVRLCPCTNKQTNKQMDRCRESPPNPVRGLDRRLDRNSDAPQMFRRSSSRASSERRCSARLANSRGILPSLYR